MSGRAVVVGSLHMDLIAAGDRMPGRGQSVLGHTFDIVPGGKAGNQAAALAAYGVETSLVARLGDDFFGRELLRALRSGGVNTEFVRIDPTQPTGASPIHSAEGDYASIIVPGAAAALSETDLEAAAPAFERAHVLVLQLELPAAISASAAERAIAVGKRVILNAAPLPAAPTDAELLLIECADTLVVNRSEARALLGIDSIDAEALARELSDRFSAGLVVVTLGAEGAVACCGSDCYRQAGFAAEVVDTVGAGDAFLGVLAACLIEGDGVLAAMRRAAAAGAIAVGARGAVFPTRRQIDAFLASLSPASG